METGKAIYNILSNASLTNDATVHPEIAPESTEFPFVVYSIQNIVPSDVKQTTSKLDESTLEVYVMSANYSECMTVAAECRSALDRNAGTFNGVEVQSISFDTAEIGFNQEQECYFVEQIYTVRVLLTGQAPAAELLPLNASSLRIKELDGTPDEYCTVLNFPATTLSVDLSGGAGAGIATYSPVYEYATFRPDETWLQGGAQEMDFSPSTPQRLPFDVDVYSSGSAINVNPGGLVYVSPGGIYKFTCFINFASDEHGHSPHFFFKVEGRDEDGEAGGMIPAQHGVDHQPAQLTRIFTLTDAERVSVWAYDESTKSGAIVVQKALIEVERMA